MEKEKAQSVRKLHFGIERATLEERETPQQFLEYQFSNSQFNCNNSGVGSIGFPSLKSPNGGGHRVVGMGKNH
jgi:hypothetical protein